MRFADIFGKGLVGALTGIDLTDMVMKGGLVGSTTGMKMPGLKDFLIMSEGKEIPFNERSLKPYHKDYNHGRTHGIGDFDGNYNPTFGDFTPEEIERMNKMYPIGNIGK
jgi:hypothetical protein